MGLKQLLFFALVIFAGQTKPAAAAHYKNFGQKIHQFKIAAWYKPAALKSSREIAAAARFVLFAQNHEVPAHIKRTLDRLFQDQEIVENISILYTSKQPNQIWKAMEVLKKKKFKFFRTDPFSALEGKPNILSLEGLILKMGCAYNKLHSDSMNVHRVIRSENIQNDSALKRIDISAPQKWFYFPPITQHKLPWAFVVTTHVSGVHEHPNWKQWFALENAGIRDIHEGNFIKSKNGILNVVDTEPQFVAANNIKYPEYWGPRKSASFLAHANKSVQLKSKL